MKKNFNESDQKVRNCFFDKTRICKESCMAAFQAKNKVSCSILWSINNLGHYYELIYLEESTKMMKKK